MKINIPYENCQLSDVTQVFWNLQPDGNHHSGVDFCPPNSYGKILVAPEKVKILKVINETVFGGNFYTDLQRGFGLTMQSIIEPNIVYLYWHCMEVFPVEEGQIVEKGQMVAQMGNSGYCLTGGVYVPLESRNNGKGSHLHFERRDANQNPDYTDVLPFIDFASKVDLNFSQSAFQAMRQMSNLLLNRK